MLKSFPLLAIKISLPEYFATASEEYALWEVIEFGDSYEALQEESGSDSVSESSAKKKGRTIAITTKDMQKMRNDFKVRTTLLLALPDEHQLRFSKLQAIVSDLEFMDVEIERDDLNQKLFTSLAPEWLINTSSGKGEVNTASTTANTQVSPTSTDIKYEDINQIDEDDIEEIDIKWNMALLSMRADRFWKKTGKKITIQGWDWIYMANEEENHALVANNEAPTEFALMAKSSSSFENKNKEGLGYNDVPYPPSGSSLLSSQERYVLDWIA
nr:hypothetical protein [Tanacetum cinerariifolium]